MPTTAQGLRYPVLTDTANVPRDLGYLAADVNGRLLTVCTSATRPTGGALFNGAMIYETDTKRTLTYDGTSWLKPVRNLFAGTEVAIVGTNPPAGTEIIEQKLHVTGVTTSVTGDFAVPFPTSFPNGLVGFYANPNSGCTMSPGYKFAYTLARGWVTCLSGASAAVANGTAVDVSGVAWGW